MCYETLKSRNGYFNKDMGQQTAKAGARQASGKKVKEFSLQGVDGQTYRFIRLQREEKFTSNFGENPETLFAYRH